MMSTKIKLFYVFKEGVIGGWESGIINLFKEYKVKQRKVKVKLLSPIFKNKFIEIDIPDLEYDMKNSINRTIDDRVRAFVSMEVSEYSWVAEDE